MSVAIFPSGSKRAKHRGGESFRDKKRKNREVKVTLEVELAIIAMAQLLIGIPREYNRGL
jgi:hypothetical protein